MFTVCVRSHFMIAHSFRGELFGPAQKLHGATYVVDVEFRRAELGSEGVVVDIGRATIALEALLGELTYKNLDDDPTLAGKNTTTEYLSQVVFDRMKARIAAGALGPGGDRIDGLKVTLHESHVAWASYEGALR